MNDSLTKLNEQEKELLNYLQNYAVYNYVNCCKSVDGFTSIRVFEYPIILRSLNEKFPFIEVEIWKEYGETSKVEAILWIK